MTAKKESKKSARKGGFKMSFLYSLEDLEEIFPDIYEMYQELRDKPPLPFEIWEIEQQAELEQEENRIAREEALETLRENLEKDLARAKKEEASLWLVTQEEMAAIQEHPELLPVWNEEELFPTGPREKLPKACIQANGEIRYLMEVALLMHGEVVRRHTVWETWEDGDSLELNPFGEELLTQNTTYDLGRYGRARLEFLREFHPEDFRKLWERKNLNRHAHMIETEALAMARDLKAANLTRWELTEELKTRDPKQYTGLENNLEATIRQMVMDQVVYRTWTNHEDSLLNQEPLTLEQLTEPIPEPRKTWQEVEERHQARLQQQQK
jgi:hypothetical protein